MNASEASVVKLIWPYPKNSYGLIKRESAYLCSTAKGRVLTVQRNREI